MWVPGRRGMQVKTIAISLSAQGTTYSWTGHFKGEGSFAAQTLMLVSLILVWLDFLSSSNDRIVHSILGDASTPYLHYNPQTDKLIICRKVSMVVHLGAWIQQDGIIVVDIAYSSLGISLYGPEGRILLCAGTLAVVSTWDLCGGAKSSFHCSVALLLWL